jgi:hypothetical protein
MATSSSISGSAIAPQSTEFADLVDRCSTALNDENNATFSDAQIAVWLNDAIRDYSQHFPLQQVASIACSAADQEYDLPADFLGILAVEYPTGETPKAYLSRLPFTHQDFGSSEKWYDIRPQRDESDRDELILSASPSAGQSIQILYNGHHALIANPSSISGDNTVPVIHQQLMIKYVSWQGALFLAAAEQASPTSNSSLLMAQLSQNARRLESGYHTAVKQALFGADGASVVQGWVSGSSTYTSSNSLARIY